MSEEFDGTVSISPDGTTRPTILLEGNDATARIGGNRQDGDVILSDSSGTERVHLNADGQRIEVHNSAGQIIGMLGGSGNIRAGSNGENGDLLLYRAEAGDIFSSTEWSIRMISDDGRLEIKNGEGELVCVLGADGNLRLGSGGDGGDVLLYRSNASSLFTNAEATVRLSGNTGDLNLGGNGVNGDINLRDTSGNLRIRLNPGNERMEVLNANGEIVGMIGSSGNLRLGSNGDGGDILLYRSNADSLFENADATVSLSGNSGDLNLGGNGVNGDINLRDTNGNLRIRLNPGSERMEVLNANGDIVGMIGSSGNLRLGSNGDGGDVLLYRSTADSLFDNGDATVSLSGNSGDLNLGGNGVNGDINLRDSEGNLRIRVNPGNERMEVLNASGDIIGMLGANGNLRLGSNGDGGDVLLYRSTADSLFTNGEATVSLSGNSGDLNLGGNGVNGDINLRDTAGRTRIRMNPGNERMEVLNTNGNIIGMLGANGNLRLGSNGDDGDILLYASGASDIFDDGDATIHMNGQTGDIILRNADCAEEFTIAGEIAAEPGMVMVLDEEGNLTPCTRAFDRGAVGVISGAGQYRPGIVLDRQPEATDRAPVALMGKVCVCVTDANGPIRVGDLLTTSDLPGHAMRAGTAEQSFGAVVGKALGPHDAGTGMIPMVIALQ